MIFQSRGVRRRVVTIGVLLEFLLLTCLPLRAAKPGVGPNLLQNAGFEEGTGQDLPVGWTVSSGSQNNTVARQKEPHSGVRCLAVPARSSVEQRVGSLKAGAYLARGWVKSEAEQTITCVLSDRDRPWSAYNCSEFKVPKGQWTRIEAFCVLDQDGSLTIQLGGTSAEFRSYHGPETEMTSPVLLDDCELVRSEPGTIPTLSFWDGDREPGQTWTQPPQGKSMGAGGATATFTGVPIFQARHLMGQVRKGDGAVVLSALSNGALQPRGAIVPIPAIPVAKVVLVHESGRSGLRISAGPGGASYTAWVSDRGLVTVETKTIPEFHLEGVRMRYGILPSFVGTDLVFAPAALPARSQAFLPSTQWLVGLEEGGDSMLVAVWDTPDQPVSLGLSGAAGQRMIDSVSVGTASGGFSVSWVEHPSLWHREPLKEDYLGDYLASDWKRPFEARWMAQMFVSPGGRRSFHDPYNDYSFPFATAKTRMWGTWFEDWNHYPFYFDGAQTMLHFEKSFAPQGDALIYFLEPAAADLYSPCEIVEQALGSEKAAALFDWDGNGLRTLKYSTPPLFMYDRPVCATTTRLSKIKQDEKPTVGVNLATHLYEFIREIRARVDQYAAFFTETKAYLEAEGAAHPELKPYLSELERLVVEGQSKLKRVDESPLSAVKAKTDAMIHQLEQGKGDGFDCGNLDVRSVAGEQDDLCRRLNRLVLYLQQTAALQGTDSPAKAAIAQHLWVQSRAILRQPTRWEPRRTLYFCEP
jgi:hypothetical protein